MSYLVVRVQENLQLCQKLIITASVCYRHVRYAQLARETISKYHTITKSRSEQQLLDTVDILDRHVQLFERLAASHLQREEEHYLTFISKYSVMRMM